MSLERSLNRNPMQARGVLVGLCAGLIMVQAGAAVFTEVRVYTFDRFLDRALQAQASVASPEGRGPARRNLLTNRTISRWAAVGDFLGFDPGRSLVLFRYLQNVLVLLLAVLWWRNLGLSWPRAWFGVLVAGWGLMYAFRDRQPEPELYLQTVLFLLAAVLASRGCGVFYTALVMAAALETPSFSVLPFLYFWLSAPPPADNPNSRKRVYTALVSLAAGLAVAFLVGPWRGWFPETKIWGHSPGWDLFAYNLSHGLTWVKSIWLAGLLPLVALLRIPAWPRRLKAAAVFSSVPVVLAAFTRFLPETRVILIPLLIFVIPGCLLSSGSGRRLSRNAVRLVIVAVALSALYSHVWILGGVDGRYLRESQWQRHNDVVSGTATSPWRYRLLSEYIVAGAVQTSGLLGIESRAVPFLAVRLMQNLIIFGMAYRYYRLLDLSRDQAVMGVLLAGWGMANAFYDSDLNFSTYTDIILYLMAAYLLIHSEFRWFPIVVGLGALNRETGVLLPAMVLPGWRKSLQKTAVVFVVGLAIFFSIFYWLRAYLPGTSFEESWGAPGWGRLIKNLSNGLFWQNLLLVINLTPLLALLCVFRWPKVLRGIGLVLVPAWLLLHLYAKACPQETRFLLVPFILVFVPGALYCLDRPNPAPSISHVGM